MTGSSGSGRSQLGGRSAAQAPCKAPISQPAASVGADGKRGSRPRGKRGGKGRAADPSTPVGAIMRVAPKLRRAAMNCAAGLADVLIYIVIIMVTCFSHRQSQGKPTPSQPRTQPQTRMQQERPAGKQPQPQQHVQQQAQPMAADVAQARATAGTELLPQQPSLHPSPQIPHEHHMQVVEHVTVPTTITAAAPAQPLPPPSLQQQPQAPDMEPPEEFHTPEPEDPAGSITPPPAPLLSAWIDSALTGSSTKKGKRRGTQTAAALAKGASAALDAAAGHGRMETRAMTKAHANKPG
jgi:hypothetical protein